MDVSSQRLAPVQHRQDLAARGLLSLFSLLGACLLTAIKRNVHLVVQAEIDKKQPSSALSRQSALSRYLGAAICVVRSSCAQRTRMASDLKIYKQVNSFLKKS